MNFYINKDRIEKSNVVDGLNGFGYDWVKNILGLLNNSDDFNLPHGVLLIK